MQRLRALEALLQSALAEGHSWQLAREAALAITPLYILVYPPIWPNLGLHYAVVAKLAAFLEDNDGAVEAADQACKVLQYTHPGAVVLQEVLRLRAEALAHKHATSKN